MSKENAPRERGWVDNYFVNDTPMKKWSEAWPDWADIGRTVQIQNEEGGTVITGKLECNDFGFDGTDEIPYFSVRETDGSEHSFGPVEYWRFAD
jgi:hypothetical protein